MNRLGNAGQQSPSKRVSSETSPAATYSPRHKIVLHHAGPSIELQLKEALAGIITDIRGEVARAVTILRDEVAAGARMTSLKESAVAVQQRKAQPQNMAEHLQQSEKEALGREFLKAANVELAGRMDYLEGLQEVMSQKLQDQWEQASQDLQQQLDRGLEVLAVRVERSSELVREELQTVQGELQQDSRAILMELHKSEKEEASHYSAVSEQIRAGLEEMDNQIRSWLVAAKTELTDRLGEVRQGTEVVLADLDQHVLQNRQRCEKLVEELDVKIEVAQGDYKGVVQLIADSIEEGSRKQQSTTHSGMASLLAEMSRIQQALNIDYVRMSRAHSVQPPSPGGAPAALTRGPDPSLRSASKGSNGSLGSHESHRRNVRAKTDATGTPSKGVRESFSAPVEVGRSDSKANRRRSAQGKTCTLISTDELNTTTEGHDSSIPPEPVSTSVCAIRAMTHVKLRDVGLQTDEGHSFTHSFAQTDPIQLNQVQKKKEKAKNTLDEEKDKKAQRALERLNGAEALKKKAKEASMKPPYNVMDYYHDDGLAQRLAKDPRFDNVSLAMVVLNALWIAVDTDGNPEALLFDAHPIFIFAENVFCLFFLWEIGVRFCAFKHKTQCLKDGWFLFDAALVVMMVLETWVLQIILTALEGSGGLPSGTSSIKMIRLVRLLRLTRMTRLLRAVPELMIVLKGLAFASRSVSVFFALWLLVIYVSAILLRQITEPVVVGKVDLTSVPAVMNMLLLNGVFPNSADFISQVTAYDWGLWIIIVPFMTLVSLTIMYMLMGVLVEVISVVASSEKEKLAVSLIANGLRNELKKTGSVRGRYHLAGRVQRHHDGTRHHPSRSGGRCGHCSDGRHSGSRF